MKSKIAGKHLWEVDLRYEAYGARTLWITTASDNLEIASKKISKLVKQTYISPRVKKVEYRGTLDA